MDGKANGNGNGFSNRTGALNGGIKLEEVEREGVIYGEDEAMDV